MFAAASQASEEVFFGKVPSAGSMVLMNVTDVRYTKVVEIDTRCDVTYA